MADAGCQPQRLHVASPYAWAASHPGGWDPEISVLMAGARRKLLGNLEPSPGHPAASLPRSMPEKQVTKATVFQGGELDSTIGCEWSQR